MAFAKEQLASMPAAVQPEGYTMQSTSAFLSPKTATVSRSVSTSVATRWGTSGTKMTIFKPLHATSTKKKYVSASQFAATASVQLPAYSITKRNLDEVAAAGSATYDYVPSGPRRVGPGGGVLPPDPFMPPVGEVPFVLLALMVAIYAICSTMKRKKETK